MRMFAVLFLFVTASVAFSAGPCAATPQAAVKAYAEDIVGDASVGFRVVMLRTDALLGVTWADMKRCDHPEWPGFSVATRTMPKAVLRPGIAPLAADVRAGQTVRVWRNERNAHLEMGAISDESGAVGDRIRLHIATPNGEPPHICFGVVRGPANVEME